MDLDIDDRLKKPVRGSMADMLSNRPSRALIAKKDAHGVAPVSGKTADNPLLARAGSTPAPSPFIIIYGKPIGKPRMTRKDKWAKRKCVTRYWAWCDLARDAAFRNVAKQETLDCPTKVQVVAWFSHKTRRGPHLLKPDGDNILKSVCDALFTNDQMIYHKQVIKQWTSGQDRVEVLITKEPHLAKETF